MKLMMSWFMENQILLQEQTVVCDVVYSMQVEQKEAKKLIRKFCKDKLDAYKIPTKVTIVHKINFGDRFKKIRRKII